MDYINLIWMAIELFATASIIITSFGMSTRRNKKSKEIQLQKNLFTVTEVMLVIDACIHLARYYYYELDAGFYYFFEILEFIVIGIAILFLFAFFIEYFKIRENKNFFDRLPLIIFIVTIILLLLNVKFNFIYSLDKIYNEETGLYEWVYNKNKLFYLYKIMQVLPLLELLLIAFINTEKIYDATFKSIGAKPLSLFVYCIIIALPIVGAFVENIIYFPFITLSLSFSVELVYTIITINHEIVLSNEVREANMRISLSQIRPHFLYNSLNAIMGIEDCGRKTGKAIANFGKYLRGNIDSLEIDTVIPFTKELDHVSVYTSLEKIRFGENLKVVYNIKEKNFSIPPLSLQMLVENGIKHGISVKKEIGTIKISSYKDKQYFYIVVEDDGVGFDYKSFKADDRNHVGLNNTKVRIERMCKGKLIIESVLKQGTKATIKIPIGDKNNENNRS